MPKDEQLTQGRDWLDVSWFGYAIDAGATVQLTLRAELLGGRPPKHVLLMVRRGEHLTFHIAAVSVVDRHEGGGRAGSRPPLRWFAAFDLPPALREDRRARFALLLANGETVELPAPAGVPPLAFEPLPLARSPRLGARALASAAAIVSALGVGPALAVAKAVEGQPTPTVITSAGGVTAPVNSAQPLASTPAATAPPSSTATTTTTTTTTTTATTATTATTTTTPASPAPAPASTTPTITTTAPSTTTTPAPASTTSSPTTPASPTSTTVISTTVTTQVSSAPVVTRPGPTLRPVAVAPPPAKPKSGSRPSCPAPRHGHSTPTAHRPGRTVSTNCGATRSHKGKLPHAPGKGPGPRRADGGAALAPQPKPVPAPAPPRVSEDPFGGGSTSPWLSPLMADPFTAAQLRQYSALVGSLTEPPKYLVRIYKAAARRYRLPWQVLAAINYVETGYGRDLAVSSAGAVGWMQFMPATWMRYGVSVTPSGKPAAGLPDPWDPSDAIFAAARYLVAAGARHDLPRAVFAYNHAVWYVQEVLSIAAEIARHGLHPGSKAARRIAAMTTMARLLNGMPYVWGGGHSTFSMVSVGYDCSGFVSAVLHAGGFLRAPQSTQTLPYAPGIVSGPGRWVTIFDRTDGGGLSSDHVIIDIEGQWWESGGWGVLSDRVHRIRHIQSAYLQSFNVVLHPRGL